MSLERVDLTAYNYGNAVAVARIYRKLGQPAKAEEFDGLAAKISAAVLAKMWRPEQQFFFSLRASDKAVADVKEVIGVYPFYFGMVPWGKGYESAWSSIIDPKQFWTKWPVASASRECPAYSQKNWPGDGRAAGCMWNGPTWPHANSLVMTAMARTLRATRDHKVSSSPLKREHLWELFSSFTKAQFRNQDLLYPWTGEFYNGDTGEWKTAERDYNHSTWLDVLIPDLLGLVPRDDQVIELDPLVAGRSAELFHPGRPAIPGPRRDDRLGCPPARLRGSFRRRPQGSGSLRRRQAGCVVAEARAARSAAVTTPAGATKVVSRDASTVMDGSRLCERPRTAYDGRVRVIDAPSLDPSRTGMRSGPWITALRSSFWNRPIFSRASTRSRRSAGPMKISNHGSLPPCALTWLPIRTWTTRSGPRRPAATSH